MNPEIQSILLGIVEGLTEFLPVSSTAHLRITEALMQIPLDDAYWKMYTIVIQLGAILALLLLFLGRIVGFLRTFPKRRKRRPQPGSPIPSPSPSSPSPVTSIPALLLHKWSEKNLGSLKAIALALLIGGIVMWIIDAWAARRDGHHRPRRGDDAPPGHLDRPLPIALRHLPRNLALHVHHRRRPTRRHDRAPPPSNSASCSPSPP